MTGMISIVTAVHGPHLRFLPEAYASLAGQVLPAGWRWEWLLQVDGAGDVPEDIAGDPRVSVGRNRASGPGCSRTMALSRATGGLVRTLDADDRLLPGAIIQDVEVLTRHPHVGWTVAPALDLHPDGHTTPWPRSDDRSAPRSDPWSHPRPEPRLDPRLEPGELSRGSLLAAWRANGWVRLPVMPSTLCARTDLLVLLGGWMALPTSEDTGLLLAASAVAPGWLHERPAQLYRRHPEQLSGTPEHLDPTGAEARRRLIVARAEALARR